MTILQLRDCNLFCVESEQINALQLKDKVVFMELEKFADG